MASPSPISELPTSLRLYSWGIHTSSKGGVQTLRGGCGKGLRGGKVVGGLLKGTHINLPFKSNLLPPLPPPFILTLVYPCCGPLGHLPPAWSSLFTLLEREGPKQGQWRLSERLSTPQLSEEVCKGASQHPFHKLHSILPHFLPTLTCLTHTHLVSVYHRHPRMLLWDLYIARIKVMFHPNTSLILLFICCCFFFNLNYDLFPQNKSIIPMQASLHCH